LHKARCNDRLPESSHDFNVANLTTPFSGRGLALVQVRGGVPYPRPWPRPLRASVRLPMREQ